MFRYFLCQKQPFQSLCRLALGLSLCLSLCLFLCSCRKASTDQEQKTITIGTLNSSLAYAPLYIAIEKGYLNTSKQVFRIQCYDSNDALRSAIRNNICDFVIAGPDLVLLQGQESEEDPLLMVWGISLHQTDLILYPTTSSDVISAADTQEHFPALGKLYCQESADFQTALAAYALKNLSSFSDMTPIPCGSYARVWEHLSEKESACLLPVNNKSIQAAQTEAISLISLARYTPKVFGHVLIAKKSRLTPDLAESIRAALEKAVTALDTESDKTLARLIAPYLSIEQFDRLIPYLTAYKEAGIWTVSEDCLSITQAQYRLMANLLEECEILQIRPAYEQVVFLP